MKKPEALEKELEEVRGRFRSLMDNCIDALIIIDEDGTVLDFNRAAEGIFQYAASEIVGQNVSQLMPEPYRSGHDRYIRNYLTSGDAKIIGIGREVSGLRKDGSVFPMDLSVGEMPDGHTRNFVGIVRDISQRRLIENQLLQASKMEAVGQLTGGIAHDFNNLLAILTMDLELLEDMTADRPESAELVAEALEVTRTGAELTQRLLAFSRRQTLNPTRLNLDELVGSVSVLLRRTLGESIRIGTSSVGPLWPVTVDRGQMENTLINLAINARDAMPEGGRLSIACKNVTVGARERAEFGDLPAGDYVCLSVSDTGTGMTTDVAMHAFEPFFTTKPGRHGTGLGLSMVYGFVKQSGGGVTLDSAPGAGTTIRLYFPRLAEPDGPAKTASPRLDLPAGREKILVVEDAERLRERTASALRRLGYEVATAADGATALAMLSAEAPPDLVLTDVVMPGGIDGPMLVQRILEKHPATKIMFMTGYAEASDLLRKNIEDGIPLLQKPFSQEGLATAVRATLDD